MTQLAFFDITPTPKPSKVMVATRTIRKGELIKNGYGRKIETHVRENNIESQKHLDENRTKFNKQCQQVLDLFKSGKRLTRLSAYSYGIASLERRVKDLREKGIEIQTSWIKVDGKNSHKEYFIA